MDGASLHQIHRKSGIRGVPPSGMKDEILFQAKPNTRTETSQRKFDGPLMAMNVSREKPLATQVEVAGSSATRTKGLLGRDAMTPGQALWIVPCEAVHTIGMRFALDLVYLDRENRIVKIRRNVLPWRFSGSLRAHSVLEMMAGWVDGTGAAVGDQIAFVPSRDLDPGMG